MCRGDNICMHAADQPPSIPTLLRILLDCVHVRHMLYTSVEQYGTVRQAIANRIAESMMSISSRHRDTYPRIIVCDHHLSPFGEHLCASLGT